MAVNTLIQLRRGSLTEWSNANPTLANGEIGYVTNNGKFKIGDGSTVWSSLGYATILPSELSGLVNTEINNTVVGGSGISVAPGVGSTVVISLSDPTIQVADITDLTATAAEINVLDGVTASTSELNYVDITTIGSAQASKAVVLDSNKDISGIRNLSIDGNLTVNGSTTTVNSTTVTIDDPIFTLGGDSVPTSDDNKDRGIEFKYHNGTSAKTGFFGFDDSTGKFTFISDATNSSEVFSGTTGEIDAKIDWSNVNSKPDPVVTINLTGDVTGSGSATLTDLASGTANISTSIGSNSVDLGTDTTGNYVASISNGNYITGGDGGSEGAALTLAVDATSLNTASKVVARDSLGNFSAGTITATLSGTSTNATNIGVTAATANSAHYLTFVTTTTGNLPAYVQTDLNYNPSTKILAGSSSTTPTVELKYFKVDGGTP